MDPAHARPPKGSGPPNPLVVKSWSRRSSALHLWTVLNARRESSRVRVGWQHLIRVRVKPKEELSGVPYSPFKKQQTTTHGSSFPPPVSFLADTVDVEFSLFCWVVVVFQIRISTSSASEASASFDTSQVGESSSGSLFSGISIEPAREGASELGVTAASSRDPSH